MLEDGYLYAVITTTKFMKLSLRSPKTSPTFGTHQLQLVHGAGKQSIARCSCTGSTGPGCSLHYGQRGASRPRPATQLRPGALPSPPAGGGCTGGHLPPQVAACACPPACARPAQAAQGKQSFQFVMQLLGIVVGKVLLLNMQLQDIVKGSCSLCG